MRTSKALAWALWGSGSRSDPILRLYHAYLGSTKFIRLSVEEILATKRDVMESYFDWESNTDDDDE